MDASRNHRIAARLREMADVLECQAADPFRIGAYRRAAGTVAGYEKDIGEVLEHEGLDGLIAIPTIGRGIATAIQAIVTTGRWPQLERLRGTLNPQQLFQTVPGIGATLAQRIHDTLHIDTLEALEMAAHDGRLKQVEGTSDRRIAAIGSALAAMLGRRLRPGIPSNAVPASLLLDLDATYRRKAATDELPQVAPKRFNPSGQSWLSIMHATHDQWHFTVMFSNTALAHKLGRNFDWVVIYYYDDEHREGQNTVVTETRGELIGKRVVRGREDECRPWYSKSPAPI